MRFTTLLILALALCGSVFGTRARAEPAAALDQYRPAPRPDDGFALSSGDVGSHLQYTAQLHLDYARKPLMYENVAGQSGSGTVALVSDQLRAQAALSLGLYGVAMLYTVVPVDLMMKGHDLGGQPTATGFGAGDLIFGGRVSLHHSPRATVALQLNMSVPTGASGDQGRPGVAGDSGVTVQPEITSQINAGPLAISIDVGARWRSDTAFAGTRFTDVMTFGAGLGWQIVPRLRAIGEVRGQTPLDDVGNRESSPLEALLGVKLAPGGGFHVGIAGGAGILSGYGSPTARVVLMFGYSSATAQRKPEAEAEPEPEPEAEAEPIRAGDEVEVSPVAPPPPPEKKAVADRDHDGFDDDNDSCPLAPGPADNAGCPQYLSYDEHAGEIALDYRFRFSGNGEQLEVVSNPALDELLAFLAVNPKLEIRVEAHMTRSSDPQRADRTSLARAAALARFLIEKGIARARLEAVGCGANRPLFPDHGLQRAKNERIAAYVLKPLPATGLRSNLGCDAVDLGPKTPAPAVVPAPVAPKVEAPKPAPSPPPPAVKPAPAPTPAKPAAAFKLVQSTSDSHRVNLEAGQIELLKPIRFEPGSAELNPRSAGYVDEIAATLHANPTMKVAIESHVAADAGAAASLTLSSERAAAIKQRLGDKGVAPERLKAYGCGETRPIAPTNVPWGQKKNERVELHVLDPAPSAGVHSSAGCKANE